MVRAALQTDQSEIWWVYLLEGIVAIVLGLLLPMGFLLLSSPVMAALVCVLLLIEGTALISWACHLRDSAELLEPIRSRNLAQWLMLPS